MEEERRESSEGASLRTAVPRLTFSEVELSPQLRAAMQEAVQKQVDRLVRINAGEELDAVFPPPPKLKMTALSRADNELINAAVNEEFVTAIRARPELADIGATILGSVVGAVVGTVVGKIVDKKLED